MSELMSIAVSAMEMDRVRIDQIGINTANATTPGFRRGVVTATSFDRMLEAAQRGGSPAAALPSVDTSVDPTAGAIQLTQRPLDLAIEGKGYFVLSDGQTSYLTRSGAMQVSSDGYLVGPRGMRVQGAQGDIYIGLRQDLLIDARGVITSQGREIATLRLADAREGSVLKSADGVILGGADADYIDLAIDQATIRSGFLESSNSMGVQDMLQLVETMRHFEGLTRLVQGYDELLGRTIQRLGDI